MKKLFLVSFTALGILMLSACGGKGSAHESTNDQGAGKTQAPVLTPSATAVPAPISTPSATPAPVAVNGGKNSTGGKNGKGGQTTNPLAPGPTQVPGVCDASGPIGLYSGYLTLADNSFVPLSLNIDVNRGSTSSGTQLKASMQIGLFGGVSVATDTTIFNFNDGSFTGTFAPATPGGTTLQLQGTIQCGVFLATKLHGKIDYDVTLSKGTKSPFTGEQSFQYDVVFPNVSKAVRGVMTVGRLAGTTPSADYSDLPNIPKLTTTFQFDDHSPIVTDTTMYDPLRGVFELSMGGGTSYLKCESVRLKSWTGNLEVPHSLSVDGKKLNTDIKCDLTSGGAVAQKMIATLNPDRIIPVSPEFYSGKLNPADARLEKFTIMADVTYMGGDGNNPPGYLFPKFPMLSAKIYICNENTFSQRIPMTAQAIDQVTGKAVFRFNPGTNSSNIVDFQASYSFGWVAMAGPLVSYQSGELGSPTIVLDKPISKSNWHGCGDLNKK